MPDQAAILPPIDHDDLVAGYEQDRDGVPFLFVPRPDNAARQPIVTFATDKTGDRYAAAETVRRHGGADLPDPRDQGQSAAAGMNRTWPC